MENRTPPQRPNIPPRPNIPQKPNIPKRPNIPPRPKIPPRPPQSSSVNLENEESLRETDEVKLSVEKVYTENARPIIETSTNSEKKTEKSKEKVKKIKEKRALGEGSKRALKLLLAGVSFLGAVACFVFLFI